MQEISFRNDILPVSYTHLRKEALDLVSHGIVDLKTRAQIERLYWSVMREVNQIAGGLKHAPDEPVSYTHLDVYKRQEGGAA